MKMMPVGAVWEEFCRRECVGDDSEWFETVVSYEKNVLAKRTN